MAGILGAGVKGAKELAKLGGLDKKAAAYLKRLTQRVKEAKTPQGKKLAKEKLMQKQGEALANAGYKSAVKNAPDPRMRSNRPAADQLGGSNRKMGGKVTKRPMGGKVYKVDNSGQMMVQRMYGGKIKKWEIKY